MLRIEVAKRQLPLSVEERIVHALRVFGFYCHRYLLPLKRERGPKGGIKISSGSGTGGFEGLIRIEVGQETATSVGG